MTSEERKKKKAELRALYEPYFESIGEPDAYYIPKPFRHEGEEGSKYLAAAFFNNELDIVGKRGHVFIEAIDYRNHNRIENCKLYRWDYNPYWNDASEGYEEIKVVSASGTYYKYAIPVEELVLVGEGKEHWESYSKQQEELPLFDMSPVSGVKPPHEPIDKAASKGKKATIGLDLSAVEEDGIDTSILKLTARDMYAIVHRKPVSSIPGINEFINKQNNS